MIRLASLSAILMFVQMCGAETDAPAPQVSAQILAAPPSPRLGGSFVRAGDHYVEFVAASDGRVEAVVVGAEGHEAPGPDVTLTAQVAIGPSARESVVLVWDEDRTHYVGQLSAPPAPGASVDLDLRVGAAFARAKVPQIVVVAVPPLVVAASPPRSRGRVVVEGPRVVHRDPSVVVQASRPSVVVHAPAPRVVIEAPHPSIVVRAPRPHIVVEAYDPRPDVVVIAPRHPSVVVVPSHGHVRVEHREEHHDHGRGRGRGHRRHGHDDDD